MRSLAIGILGLVLIAGLIAVTVWRKPGSVDAPESEPAAVTTPESGNDTDEPVAADREAVTGDPAGSATDRPDISAAADTDRHASGAARTDVVPVWEQWPQPQLALLVTGEQHGYFEPCGCTANQMGGMSRRADLFNRLQHAGWDVLGIDLGGLARRTVRQAQIKFETSLAALRDLNYVALGLGPEDLRLSPDFLLSQHLLEGDQPLRFVSANLVFYDTPELGTPVPSAVVEENGITLGITSVLCDSLKQTVLPEGANLNITWSEPEPALQQVLAGFQDASVDVRILLSHGSVAESRQLAERFPEFDVVVTAEGPGDPDPTAAPEKVGDTLLLQVGRKGKYTGVLGLYPDDSDNPVRFQLIPLERSAFDDTTKMIQHMQNYQERLRDEQIVLSESAKLHPSGASFVGSDKCGECHTTAYEIWADSGHAHALQSLDPQHQRLGYERLNGVPRMFDPECLSCHVTGWEPQEYFRFESGFLNEEFAETDDQRQLQTLMAGSGCENCHGPGSRHIELVEDGQLDLAREQVRVTLQQAKDTVCYKCHDVDNSPHFEFDEYWPKVEHKGLD